MSNMDLEDNRRAEDYPEVESLQGAKSEVFEMRVRNATDPSKLAFAIGHKLVEHEYINLTGTSLPSMGVVTVALGTLDRWSKENGKETPFTIPFVTCAEGTLSDNNVRPITTVTIKRKEL